MKTKHTALILSLGLAFGLAPLVSNAAVPDKLFCQQFDYKSHKKGPISVAVEFNTESPDSVATKVESPAGELHYQSEYEHTLSPHYRWGFEEHVNIPLLAESDGPNGSLKIIIENQGPSYDVNTNGGYHVRGIFGLLNLANAGKPSTPIQLVCKKPN